MSSLRHKFLPDQFVGGLALADMGYQLLDYTLMSTSSGHHNQLAVADMVYHLSCSSQDGHVTIGRRPSKTPVRLRVRQKNQGCRCKHPPTNSTAVYQLAEADYAFQSMLPAMSIYMAPVSINSLKIRLTRW